MDGHLDGKSAVHRQTRVARRTRATLGCEALEGRQLLSRGLGVSALGAMGPGGRFGSMRAELGSFGGGGSGAMFGAGNLGLGGGTRDPIFLLTASVLNTGSGTTPPSRSVLSSSAVQAAFQALQSDFKSDVTVGSRPSHASVGQLQDDLQAIRKGTLTGTAASTALQNDEAAILAGMGLSSTQVGQIQADLQAVQSAIQPASNPASGGTATTTTAGSTTTADSSANTGTSSPSSGTDPGSTSPSTAPMASSTAATPPSSSAPSSAVQSAFQALQSELKGDLSVNSQPTHESIGQLQDDLAAIGKGTLTGSQALTTVKAGAAAVFTGAGLSQGQITQIQSDQAALASAIQANASQAGGSTSSTSSSGASPTSIASVEATMQSIQPYLVGIPGFGGPGLDRFGGPGMGGFSATGRMASFDRGTNGAGGPIFVSRGDCGGMGAGGPAVIKTGGPSAGGSGGQIVGGSGTVTGG